MSFHELQARFRRLYGESAAWKLLRADNAPYVLAFIADLFSEEGEVPFSRARVRLDAEIDRFAEESLLRLGITVLFGQAKPFTQRCDQRGLTWVARNAG